MIKTIGFLPRRPDLSRQAFRTYYEERHAPLAAGLFPFTRYRRNHLADPADEPGFDCLSEFWVPSLEAIGALMAGPTGETMHVDERNFIDQPRNTAAIAEAAVPGPDGAASLLLLHCSGGGTASLVAVCSAAGTGLDLLTAFDARPLPCDAIALLPAERAPPAMPEGWRIGGRFELIREETPQAALLVESA